MAEDTLRFYSNSTRVVSTLFDLTFEFRRQAPLPEEEETATEGVTAFTVARCQVSVSLQHAKAIAAILTKHIKNYEAAHGVTLPLPEDMQAIWSEWMEGGKNG